MSAVSPLPAREPISQSQLEAMIDTIAAKDSDVARALAQIGYPQTRSAPKGFESFVRAVAAQQVSTHAARAIFERVLAGLDGDCCAANILQHDEDSLRALGLSRPKARYILGMAQAAQDGSFDPDSLPAMDDEDAIAHITALKGFGRWSAEIYLLFSEGREDMFPAADLAIQKGYQSLKGLNDTPNEKRLRELAQPWAPYRGAMSIFVWHWYGSTTLS